MAVRKLFKSTIIYMFGTVLSKIFIFLLLPLFTYKLSPQEFGLYDLLNTYTILVITVLYFEIWTAILRFSVDKDYSKNTVINNGILLFSISSVVFLIVFILLKLFTDFDYLIYLFFYGFLYNLNLFQGFSLRVNGKNIQFMISGLIYTLLFLILNFYFILILDLTITGIYLSSIFAYIASILYAEFHNKLYNNYQLKSINIELIRSLMMFSIPLSLNSLSFWVLSSTNKVLISNFLSIEANGYYAIAGRFSALIAIAASGFSYAWQETAFSYEGSNEEKTEFFSKSVVNLSLFLTIAFTFYMLFIKMFFHILIDSSFETALEIIPLFSLSALLTVFSGFFASIMGHYKKTNYILSTTILSAFVSVISAFILIPKYGLFGANIAMIIAYLILVMLRFIVLRELVNIKFSKMLIIPIAITFLTLIVYHRYTNITMTIYSILILFIYIYYNKDNIKFILRKE